MNTTERNRTIAKNPPILKKCWQVNLNKIREGYLYSEVVVLANERSEAKSLLLKDYNCRDMIIQSTGEEMAYTNIPVIRCINGDIIEHKGKGISRYKYIQNLEVEKHDSQLDSILADSLITHCYIKKRGSYYLSGWSGYTEHTVNAFPYPKNEAVLHARRILEIDLIPVDVGLHNAQIMNKINDLKQNLIESL